MFYRGKRCTFACVMTDTKKQTAVEWLAEVYSTQGRILLSQFEQALAMEREQIVQAFQCEWSQYNCTGLHYYANTYGKEAQP